MLKLEELGHPEQYAILREGYNLSKEYSGSSCTLLTTGEGSLSLESKFRGAFDIIASRRELIFASEDMHFMW